MPASKRHRDPEDVALSPVPKQSKIEDFLNKSAFTVPTKNRFSPLEDDCECGESIQGESVELDPAMGQADPVLLREEGITSRESTQLTLIARTVEHIFQQIRGIASQITQLSKEVHSLSVNNKQASTDHHRTKGNWRQQEQTPKLNIMQSFQNKLSYFQSKD
ncbi:Hypothetical predicted protein [Podarcis lilfordi]|uniref:Uncharacterized protein n=1 Tax=Podarcis lilfordi TaxID=74358 RepID=A0AA35NUW6_9SAUR|nr:Hypothetical predicted protein [Podarcis lilfordi]